MNSVPDKRIVQLTYIQLILYFSTWLFGIYVNGFEPSPSDTGGSTIAFFFSPSVIAHFVLGIATAIVGVMLLVFGWIYRLRKFVLFNAFSLISITIAATGGLSFVFGIGNSDVDSMMMAGSFITAFYLTFLATLNVGSTNMVHLKKEGGIVRDLSFVTPALFYIVFLSGMYLNLFVASAIFSNPPAIAQQMLGRMVTSPPALIHEVSGVFLLASVISFTYVLLSKGFKRLAVRSLVASLFVGYSLLLGVIENILPATSAGLNVQTGAESMLTSEIAPLLSAAGFLISILMVMLNVKCLRLQESPVRLDQQTHTS